jgi:hypothetical protein
VVSAFVSHPKDDGCYNPATPAGSLIAQEIGITVRALDGSVFNDRIDCPEQDRSFVAGRPEIIGTLLELIHDAQRDPSVTSPGEQQRPDADGHSRHRQAETGKDEGPQRDPKTMITAGLQAQQCGQRSPWSDDRSQIGADEQS